MAEVVRFVLQANRSERVSLPFSRGVLLVSRGTCALVAEASGRWRRAAVGAVVLVEGAVSVHLSARAEVCAYAFGASGTPRMASSQVVTAEEVANDRRLLGLVALLREETQPSAITACLAEAVRLSVLARRRSSIPPCRDLQVAAAVAWMDHDLSRRVSVSELALSVGLSRAAFARRFVAELGESPERFFTKRRLERAAERLVTSDDGLAAIAAEVGFASEHAFSRAFKRRYGVAPGGYRHEFERHGALPLRMAA